jgi:predicted transposase/invertase (TIGR01784 family)
MLYGVSKAITEYIFSGEAYAKVRKVYHINIIYFQMGDGKDYVYQGTTEFRGIHSGAVLPLTAKQKEFFGKDEVKDLYPEYYILCVEGFDDVAKNSLDEWVYYLKNTEIPDSFTARGLPEARERLRYDRLTKDEKAVYDHYVDQTRHERNVLFTSYFNGRFDGKAEGLEKGRAEGLEKGRAEGLEEGQMKNAMENAERMLKDGVPPDTVCRYTRLSKEQVEEIVRKSG